MDCRVCDIGTVEDDECDNCGAVYTDEWIELDDIAVEMWMVADEPEMETEFDTEKIAKVHVNDTDPKLQITNNDVHYGGSVFFLRGLDEVGIMGAFIYGDIGGKFRARIKSARIRLDDAEYIEMVNGGEFQHLTNRR